MKRRILSTPSLIFWIFLLSLSSPALLNADSGMAAQKVVIDKQADNYSLDKKLSYYVDKTVSLGLNDIQSENKEFIDVKGETVTLGYIPHAVWINFQLQNPYEKEYELFLELVSYIDTVKVFIVKDGRLLDVRSAGRYDPREC